MVNEDLYARMATQLGVAKTQLEKAKDLAAFSVETGLKSGISQDQINDLESQIQSLESALSSRGIVVPQTGT